MTGEWLDLYHHTSPAAAAAIYATHAVAAREAGGWVYASTSRGGQAAGYGPAVVHLRVPASLAVLDDEFPDGEQHYRVPGAALRPEHFVHPDDEGGTVYRAPHTVACPTCGAPENHPCTSPGGGLVTYWHPARNRVPFDA